LLYTQKRPEPRVGPRHKQRWRYGAIRVGASRGEDVSILSEHPHSHGVHEFLLYPLAGVEAFKLLVYDPMALLCGLLRVPGGRGLAGTGFLGPRPRE
jgi:hypothetical protein